jgi:hypothetical protein
LINLLKLNRVYYNNCVDVLQITRFQTQVVAGTKYLFDLELSSDSVSAVQCCVKLDPEPDPDLRQFADVKPKCMEYAPILALFQGFKPFLRLGSGSGSALGKNSDPNPHPDPHQI